MFASTRSDDAFEELIRRHGPMVLATCRRVLGNSADADDAFQAVFLVLARKADSVSGSLPAWLHAVARRVAANLRRASQRRSTAEVTAARPDEAPPDDLTLREGLAVLDEELDRLPERYRAVLIVCCLEGRSRDEAAAQLGCSEGQVKGRLERAREMLRQRLGRRGIELGAILLTATLPGLASAAPTLPAAAILSAGRAVSPTVVSLTNGVVHAMLVQKIKIVAAVLMMTTALGAATYRTAIGGTEAPGEVPIPSRPAVARAAPVPLNRWEKLIREKELTAKQRAAYEQVPHRLPVNAGRFHRRAGGTALLLG